MAKSLLRALLRPQSAFSRRNVRGYGWLCTLQKTEGGCDVWCSPCAYTSIDIDRLCRRLNPRHYSSLFNSSDTAFALSSGHGKCGVAVIRATGPNAKDAMLKITNQKTPPKPRYAVFGKLQDPVTGEAIDHALTLWFPGPSSFTGEDLVEFQTHGGPAVVLALLHALEKVSGCRHAEPGDFTKRAFFNGKLDLTEVEGLGDLIHAETEAQRKQALRQMEGDLGKMYQKWRKILLQLVAYVEAVIDFGEDENIEEGLIDEVSSKVSGLLEEMTRHLDDGRRGERLRSGVHVAIIGPPNAGKSSLLNILCQRPAAIVSPQAGTTRDVLESALDICGYPVVISDTAGLRGSSDPIEQEGVKRALKKAEDADLKILIADSSLLMASTMQALSPPSLPSMAQLFLDLGSNQQPLHSHGTNSPSRALLEPQHSFEGATHVFRPEDTLVVLNKTDLLEDGGSVCEDVSEFRESCEGARVCAVSCKTGDGVRVFMEELGELLKKMCGNPLAGNPSITQARHRHHLTLCIEALTKFLGLTCDSSCSEVMLDLAAEELRASIRQLGHVTGKVGVEEILDVVFKDFCIGK